MELHLNLLAYVFLTMMNYRCVDNILIMLLVS